MKDTAGGFKKMAIEKYTKNDIKNFKGDRTDWKRVENLSEKDIQQAALSDKDAPLVSDYDANKFKPRHVVRHKLGL